MKPNDPLEDRLEALGSALRARPRLTDGVMDEVRKTVADGLTPRRSPRAAIGRRWRIFAAATATSAVALLIALAMLPSPTVGWADVTTAIQAQEWIRGTVTYSDGRRAAMWLSPTRQVWARTSGSSFYFSDGRKRTKDEYHRSRERITRLPLGTEETQRVLPTNALSQNRDRIGPWLFGSEKIVD